MPELPVHPDKEWYEGKSQELGLVHKRCPYTAIGKCPLYFMSLSVFDTVFIPPEKHKKYLTVWQDTHLWHHVLNFHPKRKLQHTRHGYCFRSICPEVLFHEYGLFAFDLDEWPKFMQEKPSENFPGHTYRDSVDLVDPIREQMLKEYPPPEGHWFYEYEHVTPLHYSDCPLYEYVKEYWANHTGNPSSLNISHTSPIIDQTMRSFWYDKLKTGEIQVPLTTEGIINPVTRDLVIQQLRDGDFNIIEDKKQVKESHDESMQFEETTPPKLKCISGYHRIECYIDDTRTWETFDFNTTQAKIIEALHQATGYELHKHTIIQDILGLVVDRERIPQYFRGHQTWRKLIKSTKGGFWRLNI